MSLKLTLLSLREDCSNFDEVVEKTLASTLIQANIDKHNLATGLIDLCGAVARKKGWQEAIVEPLLRNLQSAVRHFQGQRQKKPTDYFAVVNLYSVFYTTVQKGDEFMHTLLESLLKDKDNEHLLSTTVNLVKPIIQWKPAFNDIVERIEADAAMREYDTADDAATQSKFLDQLLQETAGMNDAEANDYMEAKMAQLGLTDDLP
ncbi:uncharacterized protein MONBRDRAFT_11683 [Monosiga brevicollis MX1]|uniref:Uncharacterized protein n=1 Tax=Monosiga brevicollis TaxID=81824 RepID=A9V9Z4_MONBE|nr:uncharacterized protein MONBRDRAFT_11683 [Monosiga brevicollis MX1]EDQ85574.1 predicted protein [Monosiga brevicollis MX1]|eukprot:XP_001749523.1 hypothetical protein [Monosiga brevicollis MX1]